MEMCPLPASRGTPAGTQVGKEPHKKLVWDVSSGAAQPREETQVMLLRNMMAFRNSGAAKRRVRKAKCTSGFLIPHLNLLFSALRELGRLLSGKTIHGTDNTLQLCPPFKRNQVFICSVKLSLLTDHKDIEQKSIFNT